MGYASASDVAAYTPGLLSDGNFTGTTKPTKTAVNRFLSAGCSLIEGRLSAGGYSVPVSSTSYVYDLVSDLNALYAAGRAEMVRMTARVSATERTRSQMFMDQFNKGLDSLLKMDLGRAGLTLDGKTSIYAGGISESDKAAVKADSDREPTRFKKGMWRASGTARPAGVVTDDESS